MYVAPPLYLPFHLRCHMDHVLQSHKSECDSSRMKAVGIFLFLAIKEEWTTCLPIWNFDTIHPYDTTQERSDSDFGIKFSTVQFYAIEHNFKSNHWIKLKLYQKILEVFVYVGVNFQMNWSSERTCNIGQNRLYEFCYLLSFDLSTSYLARILFLKGCGNLFWEFSSSTKIFNELQ